MGQITLPESGRKNLKIKDSGNEIGHASIRLRGVPLTDIPWGAPAPTDLYHQVGQELSLIFRKGQALAPEAYADIIKDNKRLYYDKEAPIDWRALVDQNLTNILQAPLSTETKTEIAYGSATHLTRRIFEEFTEDSYEEAKGTVDALHHLMDTPGALESFFQLTIHDYYTYTHSVHVFIYASLLTRAVVGFENVSFLHDLGMGYLLHDIGKKDISPEILNKPGPLNDEEWAIIKTHPRVGYDVLTQVSGGLSEVVADIVLQHHEKIDGSGYPTGLREYETGRYAKICTIADAFDAISTNRSYQKAVSKKDALAIMMKSKGHFDEKLLMRFIRL